MIRTHEAQSPVPFVDLATQYASRAPEIDAAVPKVIRETDFILGREVRLFEEEFARFCEAQYATGVDYGTSALELALRAYDIGPGDDGKRPRMCSSMIAVNLRLASRFAALRT